MQFIVIGHDSNSLEALVLVFYLVFVAELILQCIEYPSVIFPNVGVKRY